MSVLEHAGNRKFWALLPLAIIVGLAAGFAVPLIASYRAKAAFERVPVQSLKKTVVNVVPVVPQPSAYDLVRDLELEKLSARNRRLEALVASLRQKNAEPAETPVLDERGPQY